MIAMSEMEQLKAAEISRLKTLGELAGGIAHEINNPLSIILGRAAFLRDMAKSGTLDVETIIKYSEIIVAVTTRIAKTIQGLRTFSRDGAQDLFEMSSIQVLVNDALDFCHEKIRTHGIELLIDDIPVALKAECRQVQISQVLINLIVNAFDAVLSMEEKWIEIQVKDCLEKIEISVTDSGQAIPHPNRSKLFDAFFTTKSATKGLGLGLSISRNIALSHAGSLELDESHENTRFILTLPKIQVRSHS